MIDDMLKGRTETDDVVAGVWGGGEELEPALLGLDEIYPVAAVESAGEGPDGTAGRIWSKMAAVLKSGITTKTKGTGLGLSISRNIIESFDGKIQLIKSPHENFKGACFEIKLPIES